MICMQPSACSPCMLLNCAVVRADQPPFLSAEWDKEEPNRYLLFHLCLTSSAAWPCDGRASLARPGGCGAAPSWRSGPSRDAAIPAGVLLRCVSAAVSGGAPWRRGGRHHLFKVHWDQPRQTCRTGGWCACVSRSKQPEVGNITVRSRTQSAVQLTNGQAAQLVLKSCAHCPFSHAASVRTLGTSNKVEHLCHADMRRYTLEWRKEAVPEAITWQDVARGGANGRIEARTGSSKPGLFCHSPSLPLVCSTGKALQLAACSAELRRRRGLTLVIRSGGRREGHSRAADSLLPAAVRCASCSYSRTTVRMESV